MNSPFRPGREKAKNYPEHTPLALIRGLPATTGAANRPELEWSCAKSIPPSSRSSHGTIEENGCSIGSGCYYLGFDRILRERRRGDHGRAILKKWEIREPNNERWEKNEPTNDQLISTTGYESPWSTKSQKGPDDTAAKLCRDGERTFCTSNAHRATEPAPGACSIGNAGAFEADTQINSIG